MPLAPSVDARSPRASRRGEAPTLGKERLVNASRATTLAGYALLVRFVFLDVPITITQGPTTVAVAEITESVTRWGYYTVGAAGRLIRRDGSSSLRRRTLALGEDDRGPIADYLLGPDALAALLPEADR